MDSFIHPNIDAKVQMGSTSLCSQIMDISNVDIEVNGIKYKSIKFKIMHDLCTNVILVLDFQPQHESVTLMFGGVKKNH